MSEGQVLDIIRESMYVLIINSAPMLIVSLVIGLIISIFQTVTSIQEQTLTFIPKIIGVFVSLIIFGPWIISNFSSYITELWQDFSVYVG